MLTKLMIINEEYLLEELESSSEDFFIKAYALLNDCLHTKKNIPLIIPMKTVGCYELWLTCADKKTNTYFYDFIKKDF